jgi:chromatin segregation and condensation protein Rec8/ScpA/Scc1 (kleisin family)
MERVKTVFHPITTKPIIPVEGKIVIILNTLQAAGTATLRDLLEEAPTLADMIASFMGVLELIKVRKILIEDPVEFDQNSVHAEETRFFLNPEAPTDAEMNLAEDFPDKIPTAK